MREVSIILAILGGGGCEIWFPRFPALENLSLVHQCHCMFQSSCDKTISLSNSSNKSAQHYEALATSNDPSSLRCKRLTIWQMGLNINFPKKYCYDKDDSRFLTTSLKNSCGSQLLRYDFSRRSLIFCFSHLCASCREELQKLLQILGPMPPFGRRT